MLVRVYACRIYDEILKTWSKSRNKYTLDEISRLAHAEPILDEWEDVERPDPENLRMNSTGQLWRSSQ